MNFEVGVSKKQIYPIHNREFFPNLKLFADSLAIKRFTPTFIEIFINKRFYFKKLGKKRVKKIILLKGGHNVRNIEEESRIVEKGYRR